MRILTKHVLEVIDTAMEMELNNLIGPDITLMRKRYDEALQLCGIPCLYQFPNFPGSNVQGESLIDSYSEPMDCHIFFEGSPKVKTFQRYGWVVENDKELPFLVHCSFSLPHVQRDSLFRISGQYAEIPDRIFRVTEITYDLVAPDHLVCQIVPVYDAEHVVGRTPTEIKQTFNSSNHFLKPTTDYRGMSHESNEERGHM